jgi:hypothetical protein
LLPIPRFRVGQRVADVHRITALAARGESLHGLLAARREYC